MKPSNNVTNYGWNTAAGPCSCSYLSPKIITIMRFLPIIRVCDIGSGNGALCASLKHNFFDCVGVEYDKQGFDLSTQSYQDIHFFNMGVKDNPTEILKTEEKFDCVITTEVIEHLYAPQNLPIFAKPSLKEGGFLIISTPYHGYIKNLMLSLFKKWDYQHTALWHGGHIKFFSRKTLASLLKDNGFEVTNFYGVGRLPFLWK